jgi:hypothetical protein
MEDASSNRTAEQEAAKQCEVGLVHAPHSSRRDGAGQPSAIMGGMRKYLFPAAFAIATWTLVTMAVYRGVDDTATIIGWVAVVIALEVEWLFHCRQKKTS